MSHHRSSIYTSGLEKNQANYTILTPLSMLERTAQIHGDLPSIVHGNKRYSWAETYARCKRLSSALRQLGIGKDDTVAVLLSNTPEMIECHFGVPGCGAVLNTINTRLDPEAVSFILEHGEAKVLIVDREFSALAKEATKVLQKRNLIIIDVDDPVYQGEGKRIGRMSYEELLHMGNASEPFDKPQDEWDAISLNYTSGTTGNPKGVVYHHRGAYQSAMNQIVNWSMPAHSVYLWTVPMFHCNGWAFPWAMAANAGLNVCLRKIDATLIWELIRKYRVGYYCAAPIVHKMIVEAPDDVRGGIDHAVRALFGGAPPPAYITKAMEEIGFQLTQIYGLTETYGPAAVCVKQPDWQDMTIEQRVAFNSRQGVKGHGLEDLKVMDPETMTEVPNDGETMGEIMFRGNVVMKGYLKNPTATEEAFRGGWFHTGDLAVVMPDGYIRIRDRSKDIIISGGENISSIEVENALYAHPAVNLAAVVAAPDEKWGEVPCAFIEIRPGMEVDEQELLKHCRKHLAGYKMPKQIIFDNIPRTSTGKLQKFLLRKRINSFAAFE